MGYKGLPPCFATYTYHEGRDINLDFDLYLPTSYSDESEPVQILRPTIVYFHGGGLTVGDKTSWFPHWMHVRAMAAGYAFIAADYSLLPPATAFEILEDIKSLFSYLRNHINEELKSLGCCDIIDVEKIIVAGSSAGGLCAYLASVHGSPKPKAVLSLYGMGGSFFTPQYLTPKLRPFFRGRELLDANDFKEFIYPNSNKLPWTSSSPLSYYGSDYRIPGYPSNPRMLLARLYLQLGIYLDYYTGRHEPSISELLQKSLKDGKVEPEFAASLFSAEERVLFPQFIHSRFPPTVLIHGSEDTAVPVGESRNLCVLLQSHGVPVLLKICEGMEHSFDYSEDAEQRWSAVFDESFKFLDNILEKID